VISFILELIYSVIYNSEAHLGIKYAGNPSNNSLPDVFHQGMQMYYDKMLIAVTDKL
jgi:hypothetical protein